MISPRATLTRVASGFSAANAAWPISPVVSGVHWQQMATKSLCARNSLRCCGPPNCENPSGNRPLGAPERRGPISTRVKAMMLLIAVGALETAREKQKSSEHVLSHRPGIAVAARGGDDHVALPQVAPQ